MSSTGQTERISLRQRLGQLRRWWITKAAGMKAIWDDPPIDLLMPGLFGALAARVYLYVKMLVTAIFAAHVVGAVLVLIACAVDVILHALVLRSMRNHLRIVVFAEAEGKTTKPWGKYISKDPNPSLWHEDVSAKKKDSEPTDDSQSAFNPT